MSTSRGRDGGMPRREFLRLGGGAVVLASGGALSGGGGGNPPAPVPPIDVLDWEAPADHAVPADPAAPITPSGWVPHYAPAVRHDGNPQVRPARRPEPVRAGRWSGRFELRKGDPVVSASIRAELRAEIEPYGAERWYAFSIFLDTWDRDRSQEIVTQWHHFSNSGSPPLAIVTHEGQWEISLMDWESPTNETTDTPVGAYRTGRWTDWVVHAKWSAGADGLLEIWRDGKKVPGFSPKVGRNAYEQLGNYMKIGIYKWDWKQRPAGRPQKPTDTTRRVMYHDEVRIYDQRGSYDAVALPR